MQFLHFLAIFSCVGSFGYLGDPVLPTLRGVSRDVVTLDACSDTKGHFLQFVALLSAGQNPCQRSEMTVSTNNGLHE